MKKILIVIFVSFLSFTNESNYVFGWTHLDEPSLSNPRGGTTSGPEIILDDRRNEYWLKLKDTKLSKFEKDRAAILSMTGNFRVNFDFMETSGFTEDYVPQRPYQTWGTEFVILVEDNIDFISLQHIMVMYIKLDDGSISEPYVVKHWRQDWKYQDNQIHTYAGDNSWKKQLLSWNDRRGTWSQSVYQVDDSPRYQSYGTWEHYENFSSWQSNETWRPLPRREASIRDDYDVMIGLNIHTITPNGWLHEQNNKKVSIENNSVLAKEIGLARYERIVDFNWDAGLEFWNNTNLFWREVRSQWSNKIESSVKFKLIPVVEGKILYLRLFELSKSYENGDLNSLSKISQIIEEHIAE